MLYVCAYNIQLYMACVRYVDFKKLVYTYKDNLEQIY